MDSFFDFIDRLRGRSDVAKTQISFWTAFFVTGVIAVIWSTTLPARFAENGDVATTTSAVKADTKSFTESFAARFGVLKDQVGSIIEGFGKGEGEQESSESAVSASPARDTEQSAPRDPVMATPKQEERAVLIATSSKKTAE